MTLTSILGNHLRRHDPSPMTTPETQIQIGHDRQQWPRTSTAPGPAKAIEECPRTACPAILDPKPSAATRSLSRSNTMNQDELIAKLTPAIGLRR